MHKTQSLPPLGAPYEGLSGGRRGRKEAGGPFRARSQLTEGHTQGAQSVGPSAPGEGRQACQGATLG